MDISWWFYAIAIVIGLVVWKTWRWEGGLLTGYAFLVLVETLLIRKPFVGSHFQPELFWSWRVWEKQRTQILTNMIMFIPVGMLAGWIWRWKGLTVAVGLSCVIELLQFATQRGLMEFDDVIHNCLGAAIGISAVMLVKSIASKNGEIENGAKAQKKRPI